MNKWEQILSRVDFEAEFMKLPKAKKSGNEVMALCPFHEDSNPSFNGNIEKGVYKCHACPASGDYFQYYADLNGLVDRQAAFEQLAKQYGIAIASRKKPDLEEKLIEDAHDVLMKTESALRWMGDKRGYSAATLRRFQIGWDPRAQRNYLPVRDAKGKLVNIRLYNRKKKSRFQNWVAKDAEDPDIEHRYGKIRLFNVHNLASRISSGDDVPFIVWTEGEWDCIAADQAGFVAVSGTGGCNSFKAEWLSEILDLWKMGSQTAGRKPTIVFVYDVDQAGKSAIKENILPKLREFGDRIEVKVLWLPLEGSKDSKDLTDFFIGGHGKDELQELIDKEPLYVFPDPDPDPENAAPIELKDLREIRRDEYCWKRVTVPLTVTGHSSVAYSAVKKFEFRRCKLQEKGNCLCHGEHEVPKGHPAYIACCMSADDQVDRVLRQKFCLKGQRPAVEVLERTGLMEAFAVQYTTRRKVGQNEEGEAVEVTAEGSELEEFKIYCHAPNAEVVEARAYQATGWVVPSPKAQTFTLLCDELRPLDDDFEQWELNSETREHLELIRGLEIEGLLRDLEENVTRIYRRDHVLLAVLFAFCCPIHMKFNRELIRGWIFACVIGDPGTGKTSIYNAISDYIGVGDLFSGLSGSRTGLSYAIVESRQKGWQIRPGRLPCNNRKILAIDETQKLEVHDLESIAKALDEGELRVDRAAVGTYETKTRLLCIANPVSEFSPTGSKRANQRPISSFPFGIKSLLTIFSSMLIRRVDIAVIAAQDDITPEEINRFQVTDPAPKVSPDALRSLVFWAWTRKADQVEFTDEATKLILQKAGELSEKFGRAPDIQILFTSDARKTIARLSAAFAILCVSTDDDFEKVIVEADHVEDVVELLDNIYTRQNCRLDLYSASARSEDELIKEEYEGIRDKLLEEIESECRVSRKKRGRIAFVVFRTASSKGRAISGDDLRYGAGISIAHVKKISSRLKDWGLIRSSRSGYFPTGKMYRFWNMFCEEFQDNNIIEKEAKWRDEYVYELEQGDGEETEELSFAS